MTPATDAAREAIARIVCDIVVQITCAENASDASIHAQVDQNWHHWTCTADRILALTKAASQPHGGEGQDRKFAFRDGQFVNQVSGEPIPADEPVIIFRARDWHALDVLSLYQGLANDPHHLRAIQDRINEFQAFKDAHPERMKEPGITRHIALTETASQPREGDEMATMLNRLADENPGGGARLRAVDLRAIAAALAQRPPEQAGAVPAGDAAALVRELRPLINAAAGPNGWDWTFPIRVRPVDGKPTIVANKGGNLFRGFIATWDEAHLFAALANAVPRIMAALSPGPASGGVGAAERAAGMDTAPKDGTMIRLLVDYTDGGGALEDDHPQSWTIGFNNLGNTGEDRWQFAGWSWEQDVFCEGSGKPVGWLPWSNPSAGGDVS